MPCLKYFVRGMHSFAGLRSAVGADICPQRAHVPDANDQLERVLEAMAEQAINAVLVLREGELAGIFTTTDACQLLAERLRYDERDS